MLQVWAFIVALTLASVGRYARAGPPSSSSALCPKRCQELGSDPVCGTDGVIYGSECELRRRNCRTSVTVVPSLWKCTERGSCSAYCYDHYDPVCATNGRTYKNKCKLALDACREGDIHLAHAGPCLNLTEREICPLSCPPVRGVLERPVCGADGNVYRSECQMRLLTCGQKVAKASFTHCKSTQHCLDHCRKWFDPVCGSDGRVYSNACLMQQQNCGKHVYQVPMVFCLGGERNKYDCPSSCRSDGGNSSVCGSDGNVYDSECEMKMLNCGSFKEDVAATPLSNCRPRISKCQRRPCGGAYSPVCGSDGRTYSNECEFQVAVCKKGISRAHDGICYNLLLAESCPQACPPKEPGRREEPVCGSDGNVYRNACEMKKRTCGQRVVPIKSSRCSTTAFCDASCTVNPNATVVCGADGNLYKSHCHMRKYNCGKHIFEVPLYHCLRGRRDGCKEYCPPVLQPVCANDGKVYPNPCFLGLENCRTRGRIRQDPSSTCGIPTNYINV